jgi:hypothetical protein
MAMGWTGLPRLKMRRWEMMLNFNTATVTVRNIHKGIQDCTACPLAQNERTLAQGEAQGWHERPVSVSRLAGLGKRWATTPSGWSSRLNG